MSTTTLVSQNPYKISVQQEASLIEGHFIGEFLVNQDLIPKSQHLICLAAIPQGILEHSNRPNEICLADLTLPSICWNEENGEKKPGEEKIRVPSVWGDDWIMMLNF